MAAEKRKKTLSEKKRATVGSESLALSKKKQENISVIDQMRANLSDYEKNIRECVETNIKGFRCDFYVVVVIKKERLMQNVMRNYYFARRSCPTPDYDQIVYKYDFSAGTLEFLWVIPSKDSCEYLLQHRMEVGPEEMELLGYVMGFADGSLLKKSKRINNERDDSNILVGSKADAELIIN